MCRLMFDFFLCVPPDRPGDGAARPALFPGGGGSALGRVRKEEVLRGEFYKIGFFGSIRKMHVSNWRIKVTQFGSI